MTRAARRRRQAQQQQAHQQREEKRQEPIQGDSGSPTANATDKRPVLNLLLRGGICTLIAALSLLLVDHFQAKAELTSQVGEIKREEERLRELVTQYEELIRKAHVQEHKLAGLIVHRAKANIEEQLVEYTEVTIPSEPGHQAERILAKVAATDLFLSEYEAELAGECEAFHKFLHCYRRYVEIASQPKIDGSYLLKARDEAATCAESWKNSTSFSRRRVESFLYFIAAKIDLRVGGKPRLERGCQQLRLAINMWPDNARYKANLAVAIKRLTDLSETKLERVERLEEAIDWMSQAIARPSEAEIHHALNLNNHSEFLLTLVELVRELRADGVTSTLRSEEEAIDLAIESAKLARDLHPRLPEAHITLAEACSVKLGATSLPEDKREKLFLEIADSLRKGISLGFPIDSPSAGGIATCLPRLKIVNQPNWLFEVYENVNEPTKLTHPRVPGVAPGGGE